VTISFSVVFSGVFRLSAILFTALVSVSVYWNVLRGSNASD